MHKILYAINGGTYRKTLNYLKDNIKHICDTNPEYWAVFDGLIPEMGFKATIYADKFTIGFISFYYQLDYLSVFDDFKGHDYVFASATNLNTLRLVDNYAVVNGYKVKFVSLTKRKGKHVPEFISINSMHARWRLNQ